MLVTSTEINEEVESFVRSTVQRLLVAHRLDELEEENARLRHLLKEEEEARTNLEAVNVEISAPPEAPTEENLDAMFEGLNNLERDALRLGNALGYLVSASETKEHFEENTAEIRQELDDVQTQLESVVAEIEVSAAANTEGVGSVIDDGDDSDDDWLSEMNALSLYQALQGEEIDDEAFKALLQETGLDALLSFRGNDSQTLAHALALQGQHSLLRIIINRLELQLSANSSRPRDALEQFVNLVDDENRAPVHCALSTRNSSSSLAICRILDDLVRVGGRLDLLDAEGRSVLHYAAASDNAAAVELICKHHEAGRIHDDDNCSFINLIDAGGRSALHAACAAGGTRQRRLLIVSSLLSYGANIGLRDKAGAKPVDLLPRPSIERPELPADVDRTRDFLNAWRTAPPSYLLALRSLSVCRVLFCANSPFLPLPASVRTRLLRGLLIPSRLPYPIASAPHFTVAIHPALFSNTHLEKIVAYAEDRSTLPRGTHETPLQLAQKLMTL